MNISVSDEHEVKRQKTCKDNRDVDEDNTTDGDREDLVVGMNSFQHPKPRSLVTSTSPFLLVRTRKLVEDLEAMIDPIETKSTPPPPLTKAEYQQTIKEMEKLCSIPSNISNERKRMLDKIEEFELEIEEINVWKKHEKQKKKLRLKDVPYSPKRCVYCGWVSKSCSSSNSNHSLKRHIEVKHQNKK